MAAFLSATGVVPAAAPAVVETQSETGPERQAPSAPTPAIREVGSIHVRKAVTNFFTHNM